MFELEQSIRGDRCQYKGSVQLIPKLFAENVFSGFADKTQPAVTCRAVKTEISGGNTAAHAQFSYGPYHGRNILILVGQGIEVGA